MRRRDARLIFVVAGAAALALAAILASFGLKESVAFFRTPSELLADDALQHRAVSLGGLVEPGSLGNDDGRIVFRLTDDAHAVTVVYGGQVPDLFREGQCVIAQGRLGADGRFEARRVLAKHDENYVPREIGASPRLAQSCGKKPS